MADVLTRLDDLPSPFLDARLSARRLGRVLYESYRGCAFRCSFCLYQRDYAALREFSLERVKADLDAIMRSGPSHVRVVGATFNLDRPRAKEILRHLQGCRADVCVEVSAEFFDSEMIDLLPGAGIRHVDIGLQSTQPSALRAVHREWYRRDRFRQNLRLLREQPALTLNVELIAGLPGDDVEGVRRSLDEAVLSSPDHVSIYRLLGLRGTPLHRDADRLGLRFSPEPPYQLLESTGFSRADLDRLDELTFANLVLFNLGVGRYALRFLVESVGCRPTAVYDEFITFVTASGTYDDGTVRYLGRYHGYGNRFDQPMPAGLELLRVSNVLADYFRRGNLLGASKTHRQLALHLVDFGYTLATLDGLKVKPVGSATEEGGWQLAPWCRCQSFPPSVVAELERQGHAMGDLAPADVDAIIFFVHPELGPAAMAVDRDVVSLLDGGEKCSSGNDVPALKVLRDLDIIVGRVPV